MKKTAPYLAELSSIADSIGSFYDATFASPEEEYQANRTIKEQIGQLILQVKQVPGLPEAAQQQVVDEALMLLAKNTGCAEDEEIAEYILDQLYMESKVIDQQDLDRYYAYKQNRWD